MKTKKCTKCKRVKSVDKFHKSERGKDGLFSYCKKCRKDHDNSYYRTSDKKQKILENRREIRAKLATLKAEQGCKHCPENDPCCLDFHHISNDKEFCLSDTPTTSWIRILKEVDKCDVVCSNCHRKIHAGKLYTT